MDGWIKLHRQICHHKFWTDDTFSRGQAWVDLLMLANTKTGIVRKRGNRVDVERGQVGVSIKGLADRWKWSQGKVRRFLEELENDEQIELQISRVTTVLTITNYNRYQLNGELNGEQTENRRRTDGEQTETNKKELSLGRFKKPKIEEVAAYCRERSNSVDPESFWNFYEAKGWKVGNTSMRSWKACVRTWERRTVKEREAAAVRRPVRGDMLTDEEARRSRIRARLVKEHGIRDDDELERLVELNMKAAV